METGGATGKQEARLDLSYILQTESEIAQATAMPFYLREVLLIESLLRLGEGSLKKCRGTSKSEGDKQHPCDSLLMATHFIPLPPARGGVYFFFLWIYAVFMISFN
jgi:hypothetical protein